MRVREDPETSPDSSQTGSELEVLTNSSCHERVRIIENVKNENLKGKASVLMGLNENKNLITGYFSRQK